MAVLLLAAAAAGQVTQTGNLMGTIYDKEKEVLPGVTVSISSPALILPKMEMVTTERGFYRFPALPPGLYKITYSLPNFQTLVRENIRVMIGETTTVDASLEVATVNESVTVTGQSPTVDLQRTTLTANMTKEILQALPVARNLGTFFNMAPGVTADTVHGSAERDNTYNLDGVNVTDPVTGTRAGNFSIDIMEELSVQTAGLPAEYGSVRGGVVNVVTKSGGNRWSGMASFYFRNDKFQSTNNKGTVFEGQKSGFDFEYEPGLNLGGPLVKDKVWVYGNFSLLKSQEYSPGYPYDKQPENTPLDFFRSCPYGKMTWQISDKDKLVLSYNYSSYTRHHRDAGVSQTEDTTWNQTTPIHTVNGQFSHFFSSDWYMNVKAAGMFYQLNLTAKNDLPNIYDSVLRRNYQSYGYDDIYRRNRVQAVADTTYFVDNWFGRHEFKAGLESEYSWDSRTRRHNLDPKTGLGPFFVVRSGVPDYVSYYQDLTRKDAKFVLSGFLQDFWTPFERLTLSLGLRFDHQEGILPKQGTDRATVTYGGKVYDPSVKEAYKPLIWNTFSPRFGLVFDLTNDDKTVLKASWGRYYIANIMQFFVWVNPNGFISYRYRLNPDFTPTGSMYNFSAQADASMDPDAKAPYIDEFTVGVERELFRDFKLGVRYIRKWDRNLLESVDLNALNYDALMRGDDIFRVWTNFTPVTAVDPFDGKTVTFWSRVDSSLVTKNYYTNPPGANRDYDGVELTATKRLSNRWQLAASYVYAKSRGLIGTDFDDSAAGSGYYNNPNAHINAVGNFPAERRHQVKLNGMWQGPWGITFSGYYRYLEGTRYTRQIRSQDLGLNLPQGNVTILAETRGARNYPGLSLLDLRAEKMFRLPGRLGQVSVFLDAFNVLNINTTTTVNVISSSPVIVNNQNVYFEGATALTDPRVFRLGFRFEY